MSEARVDLANLAAQIERRIQRPWPESDFGTLALELFRLQFEANPPYRRLCEFDQRTPANVMDWSQIPAAPTAAFKEFELTSLPPEQRAVVFHSSGTTARQPSRHYHSAESLRLYELSLLEWFGPHLLPEAAELSGREPVQRGPVSLVALTPAPAQAPHSSLVHMFACVLRHWGDADSFFAGRADESGAWELDGVRLLTALAGAEGSDRPVMLLGSAFSFVHLSELCERRGRDFRLPTGSRAMQTGGYKGRSRAMPLAELHRAITRHLGIPEVLVLGEYGMSELSSQAYDGACGRPGPRRYHFPPWARARVISPETGREAADGEAGLLRVFDLANAWSVLAVQTDDLAVRRGDGFELLGRAPASEPRGCSLMTA